MRFGHGVVEHVDVQEGEQRVLRAPGLFVTVAQRSVGPRVQLLLLADRRRG